MNKELWNNILVELFLDKKNLQKDFEVSSRVSNYNKLNKSIAIKVEKQYLFNVLTGKVEELKNLLEKELNDYLFTIKINDSIFDFNSTSINEKISHVAKKDIINIPISYKTTEKLISGESKTFSKVDEKIKNREVDLFFYNKLLYSTKTIKLNYKIINNQRDKRNLLIFSWTIIIPFYFLIKISINKIKFNKIKREIKNLLDLKYVPLNRETRRFIEFYI